MKNVIFIKGNVPSSKNSKQIVMRGGKPIMIWSKLSLQYIENTQTYWDMYRDTFIQLTENLTKPYRIGFHFIRDSRRAYDWVNPVQTIQDLMVRNRWIKDDNVKYMLPFPSKLRGEYTTYDKERAGVRIKVNSDAKKEFKLY